MDAEKTAITLLKTKIDQITTLYERRDVQQLEQWKNETLMILDNLIGEDSKYYEKFVKINYRPMVFTIGETTEEDYLEPYQAGLNTAKAILNAIVYGIENNLT